MITSDDNYNAYITINHEYYYKTTELKSEQNVTSLMNKCIEQLTGLYYMFQKRIPDIFKSLSEPISLA